MQDLILCFIYKLNVNFYHFLNFLIDKIWSN